MESGRVGSRSRRLVEPRTRAVPSHPVSGGFGLHHLVIRVWFGGFTSHILFVWHRPYQLMWRDGVFAKECCKSIQWGPVSTKVPTHKTQGGLCCDLGIGWSWNTFCTKQSTIQVLPQPNHRWYLASLPQHKDRCTPIENKTHNPRPIYYSNYNPCLEIACGGRSSGSSNW